MTQNSLSFHSKDKALHGNMVWRHVCSALVLTATQDACIELAKTKGKFENGIVSLQGMQSITCVSRELLHVDAASGITA